MTSELGNPGNQPGGICRPSWDHLYVWGNNTTRRHLKGKRCRIVASGSHLFSVLLEFEDGTRIITSARAVRKIQISKD